MTAWSVGVALALSAPGVAAAPRAVSPEVSVLPGASQKISHSLSASRDTAALGYQLTPYSIYTAGADFALIGLDFDGISARLGFFGFLELESDRTYSLEDDGFSALLPRADIKYWRGHNGIHLAMALDAAGQRLFGRGGLVEATLGFHHESEHFTGSTSGDEPQFGDVPHIGDFVLTDLAARVPVGRVDFELRLQSKTFLPVDTGDANGDVRAYTLGPGFDFIVRWRLSDSVHPFSSTFGEYLFGNDFRYEGQRWDVPDNYLLRNLTGLIFPGEIGDIQVFNSLSVGHGKGLKVYREELLWGGGVRVVFF